MKINKEINIREEKLLNYLWNKNIPMTSTEMVADLGKEGWKQITLLKTVQSLTEKGYLEVVGLEKSVKTYARKFVPALTKNEFYSQMILEKGLDEDSIVDITAALIGVDGQSEEGTQFIIGKLEDIINNLKSDNGNKK